MEILKGKNQMKNIILATIAILCLGVIGCSEPNGPEGGGFWERIGKTPYVWEMAIASNGDIWAGGQDIYLSTDNGNTWINKGSMPYLTSKIAINETNGSVFVRVSGDQGAALYRSTNNGENWEQLLDYFVNDICITLSGEIYIGVDRYIFYSSDNGDTWIEKSNGLIDTEYRNRMHSIAEGTDGTLYVGTARGIYRSTDGGDEWLPPSNHKIYVYNLTVSDDGSIFATAGDSGVFKSTDKGVTWTKIIDKIIYEIIYNTVTKDIFICNERIPKGANVIISSIVYRSTDLGASWESINNNGIPTNSRMITLLAFNPNTGQMYVAVWNNNGSEGVFNGVYRSK